MKFQWSCAPNAHQDTGVKYACSREQFTSHFIHWVHSHVKHAAPAEPAHKDRSRYTPNRKRSDRRRSQYSPSGARTPKSGTRNNVCNHSNSLTSNSQTSNHGNSQTSNSKTSKYGNSQTSYRANSQTPQTPFKDSIDSMTDYPPLSSSTPVDAVSRVTEPPAEQVLVVKRKVDFSRSSSDNLFRNVSQSNGNLSQSNGNLSQHQSSPPQNFSQINPPLRVKYGTPASESQLSQWTHHVKEHSPFASVDKSLPDTGLLPGNSQLTNSQFTSCTANDTDFNKNITPTKSKRVSLLTIHPQNAATNTAEIDKSPVNIFTIANTHKGEISPFLVSEMNKSDLSEDSITKRSLKTAEINNSLGCQFTANIQTTENIIRKNSNIFLPPEIEQLHQNKSNMESSGNGFINFHSINSDLDNQKSPTISDIKHTPRETLAQVTPHPSNPPPSRKKKSKRVPLLTISNHAQPNRRKRAESGSDVTPDQLSSYDEKYSKRLGGGVSGSGLNNCASSFRDNSSFSEVPGDTSNHEKDCPNSHEEGRSQETSRKPNPWNMNTSNSYGKNISNPWASLNRSHQPSVSEKIIPTKIIPTKITPTKITPTEINNPIGSTTPVKITPVSSNSTRVMLTPVKICEKKEVSEGSEGVEKLSNTLDRLSLNESCERNGMEHDKQNGAQLTVENLDETSDRELVHSIAEIYTVLLNEVMMPNLATELFLLFSMIRLSNILPVSVLSKHRIYFVSSVIKGLEVWVMNLAPLLMSELSKHLPEASLTPPTTPSPPLFDSAVSITSVAFQLEEDTRPQFPNDRVFHVFKRIRDSFHGLLREWEEGQKSHTWNTEAVLGDRMKSLLNQKLQLAIFTHFSKLFISLLLKRYKVDLCQNSPGFTPATDKLKKLHNRMVESGRTETKLCAPASFPLSQDFFKTFVVVSQNYSLNKHLTDHLVAKITQLDKQTKSWFLGSMDMEQSDLNEDFTWNMLALQLLAKFLGLLCYMPYYTGQKIPPSVLNTLRESRTEPFPLDISNIVKESVMDGTLVLTVPWVCDLLAMMDSVCVTLPKARDCLDHINNIYCQLNKLPIEPHNKLLLLFKIGWLTELVMVPHGLFVLSSSQSFSYEPTLDNIPMVSTSLLYACCPWLHALKHPLNKQHCSQPSPQPLLTKISSIKSEVADDKIQLQLRENFFHNQPHTVRKVCEFLCERIHSNAIQEIQNKLKVKVKQNLEDDIRVWVDIQDNKELLEDSFSSRLQFYISSVVSTFCEKEHGHCDFRKLCEAGASRLMSEILRTEQCVVSIATKLTVEKAVTKCSLWWKNMAVSFVEREVSLMAESYIKHVLSEVGEQSLQGLQLFHDNLENFAFEGQSVDSSETLAVVRDTVVSKDNTPIFQQIAHKTVNMLTLFVQHTNIHLRSDLHHHSENIFKLCLILRDKKNVELPLFDFVHQTMNTVVDDNCSGVYNTQSTPAACSPANKFIHVCLQLLSMGVLTPIRLEHWLLWYVNSSLSTVRRRSLVGVIRTVISQYEDMRSEVLSGRRACSPGIAHFLKQYIVSDFEIVKSLIANTD